MWHRPEHETARRGPRSSTSAVLFDATPAALQAAHELIPTIGCGVPMLGRMATTPRSVLASAIGWVIVALVAIWLFGMVIGWIGFVLRSIVWIVLIGVLIGVYLSVKEPPDA